MLKVEKEQRNGSIMKMAQTSMKSKENCSLERKSCNVLFMRLQCPQQIIQTFISVQLKVILKLGTTTIHYRFVQKDITITLSCQKHI